MRRRVSIVLAVLFVLTLLGSMPPVLAQEGDTAEGVDFPELAPLNTIRSEYVTTFNDTPLQVCHQKWEAVARRHQVCRYFFDNPNEDAVAGDVIEEVYYDGITYTRKNDQQTWQAEVDVFYDPESTETLNEELFGLNTDGIVSRFDEPVIVNGVPTSHYQFWVTDELVNELIGGQLVGDLFVSDSNLVLKGHVSIRGLNEDALFNTFGLGDGDLHIVRNFFDHNGNILVAQPPAELVEQVPEE